MSINLGTIMPQGIRKTEQSKSRVGEIVNNIKLIDWLGSDKNRKSIYKCVCGVCQKEYITSYTAIVNAKSSSCGCIAYKIASLKQRKHGYSLRSIKPRKEYATWKSMRSRCNNPNNKDYRYYGGKGVKVCERWNDFTLFLLDMGSIPEGDYTIDRIDPEKNYEPTNCRWITRKENAKIAIDAMWNKLRTQKEQHKG